MIVLIVIEDAVTHDELINKTDTAISELVRDNKELQKAYNYYNGVRDKEQFRYLEENFGLGNPTSIEFTPLLRKHVDALIGEYLGTPIIPKVQCKDQNTIANIEREKQLKIISSLHNYLTNSLQNSILKFVDGKNYTDTLIEQQINKLIEDINVSFISEYEIAAQNVIEYIMQSRTTDITNVLKTIFLDLLISGYTYYKTEPTSGGNNIKIRPLNPLNVFPDINIESPYIKDSYRIVVRTWMTKTQILNKYGKELSKEDVKKIKEHWESLYDSSTYYIKGNVAGSDGILAGEEVVVPGMPTFYNGSFSEYIPVYEVEWLETDADFVMQRYETIRIGDDVYILRGKNEKVIRSQDNPNYCGLSVNGVYFLNRGTKPYSLILACASLQDRYDILNFYRDRLIASSGTTGDFIDLSLLPTFLGDNPPERLQKFVAYKKGGIAPIDSSQPGRLENGQTPLNTIFNGYDDTLKAQAVQAIQIAIESIEQTVSSITGVFRERLNGIEERDAVSNIKQGVNNSFIITKQYYHQMDLVTNEILVDSLNLAKIVFKNGLTGTLILGDKYQKVFTALPEYFTFTDHDIRIITSTDVIKDLEYMKQTIPELAKSGIVSADIIIEALTAKSVTDLKNKALASIKKQKEENDQLQQLSQELEKMQEQYKQCEQQLKQAQKKIESLNEAKIQLEQQKLQLEYKVDWFNAQTERTYKNKIAEEAEKRTEIEIAQIADGNPYNDKVKQLIS